MHVLIVGINGFLGNELLRQHLNNHDTVDGIFNKNRQNIPNSIKTFHISQLNEISTTYDIIYIVSAYIPYGNMNTPNSTLVSVNLRLVDKVCQHFSNTRIVFCSSISIYGQMGRKISEKSPLINPNLYGLSKLAGEFIVKNHSNYAIIRFSSLYGIGMSPSTFIPRVIQQAKTTNKIMLWGDGSRKQDYLHIEDAASYCIKAAQVNQNCVLLGVNGKSHSNLEVAKAVSDCLPNTSIVFQNSDLSLSSHFNNNYTQTLLNFTPQKTLKKGLIQLIHHE